MSEIDTDFYQRLAEAVNQAYANSQQVMIELARSIRLSIYVPKYRTAMRITIDAPADVSVETIAKSLKRAWPKLKAENSLKVDGDGRSHYAWTFILPQQHNLRPGFQADTIKTSDRLSKRARSLAQSGNEDEAKEARKKYDEFWNERETEYLLDVYGGAYGNLLSDATLGVDVSRLRKYAVSE